MNCQRGTEHGEEEEGTVGSHHEKQECQIPCTLQSNNPGPHGQVASSMYLPFLSWLEGDI